MKKPTFILIAILAFMQESNSATTSKIRENDNSRLNSANTSRSSSPQSDSGKSNHSSEQLFNRSHSRSDGLPSANEFFDIIMENSQKLKNIADILNKCIKTECHNERLRYGQYGRILNERLANLRLKYPSESSDRNIQIKKHTVKELEQLQEDINGLQLLVQHSKYFNYFID